jgi:hypothetical protein
MMKSARRGGIVQRAAGAKRQDRAQLGGNEKGEEHDEEVCSEKQG